MLSFPQSHLKQGSLENSIPIKYTIKSNCRNFLFILDSDFAFECSSVLFLSGFVI